MGDKKKIIFGRKPVIEALKSGIEVEKILVEEGTSGPFEIELRELTKSATFAVQYVHPKKFHEFTQGNHQGVIMICSMIKYYKLEDVIQHVFEQGEIPLFLILDGITDVRNFGAIARTAEVFGVHSLVTSRKGSAMVNEFAIKASAGALTKIPVCREKNITNAIELLKSSGVAIYASDLNSEKNIDQLEFNGPCALIIGSEDQGVNRAYLRAADETFLIPQAGEIDSLNVSVAAGVMLYEITRQRGLK